MTFPPNESIIFLYKERDENVNRYISNIDLYIQREISICKRGYMDHEAYKYGLYIHCLPRERLFLELIEEYGRESLCLSDGMPNWWAYGNEFGEWTVSPQSLALKIESLDQEWKLKNAIDLEESESTKSSGGNNFWDDGATSRLVDLGESDAHSSSSIPETIDEAQLRIMSLADESEEKKMMIAEWHKASRGKMNEIYKKFMDSMLDDESVKSDLEWDFGQPFAKKPKN